MARIIALSGWKRSGKDAALEYLRDKYAVLRFAFADRLKFDVAKEYDINTDDVFDNAKKELALPQYPVFSKDKFSKTVNEFMSGEFRTIDGHKPVGIFTDPDTGQVFEIAAGYHMEPLYHTIRSLCILNGSVKRSVSADYWVERAVKNLDDRYVNVITDLRYRSEVESLRRFIKKGDTLDVIRINRFDFNVSSDPSETDMDNFKFEHIIENRGTLEEFHTKIDSVYRSIVKGN